MAVDQPAIRERWASSRWPAYLLRRIGRLAVSVWVLITASFFMIHLIPGDPIRAAMGLKASAEAVAARRQALGLNDPIWLQYVRYLRNTLTGHFGTSIVTNVPVSETISQRLPATVEISVLAFIVVIVIAVPLGLLMAILARGGQHGGLQLGFATSNVIIAAIPDFLLAVVLVYLFSVRLDWFPVAGRSDASSYVLPVIALAAGPVGILARIVRIETLSVLGADFIRTARSKRLPARLIYLRHAMPNALTATLTFGGILLTGLMAGTVLVESVFAWPGLGTMIVQSIQQKDYPTAQAMVLVYGGLVLLVNLIVDLLLAFLNPRSTLKEA
ncbi:MAG: ABC transporter permease [Actinomycetota bacterium]|nr:ABC transporter permease [Actinomycetota bacterium]